MCLKGTSFLRMSFIQQMKKKKEKEKEQESNSVLKIKAAVFFFNASFCFISYFQFS